MKKKFLSFVLIAMALLIVTGCGNEETKKPDGGKTPGTQDIDNNTNENVIKTQIVDGLEISKLSVIKESGMSKVSGTVTNKTAEKITLTKIKATVTAADGTTASTLSIDIGDSIEAGASVTFQTKTDTDLMTATKIVYEVIK